MLICRVLLGDPWICKEDSYPLNIGGVHNGLPFKDPNDHSKGTWDSLIAVDNQKPNSKTGLVYQEYVVYNNDAIYPEFIVRYKRREKKPEPKAPSVKNENSKCPMQ